MHLNKESIKNYVRNNLRYIILTLCLLISVIAKNANLIIVVSIEAIVSKVVSRFDTEDGEVGIRFKVLSVTSISICVIILLLICGQKGFNNLINIVVSFAYIIFVMMLIYLFEVSVSDMFETFKKHNVIAKIYFGLLFSVITVYTLQVFIAYDDILVIMSKEVVQLIENIGK